jgi:hypothetical protein
MSICLKRVVTSGHRFASAGANLNQGSTFAAPTRLPPALWTIPCFDEPVGTAGQMRLPLRLPVLVPEQRSSFLQRLLARTGEPIIAAFNPEPFTEPLHIPLLRPSFATALQGFAGQALPEPKITPLMLQWLPAAQFNALLSAIPGTPCRCVKSVLRRGWRKERYPLCAMITRHKPDNGATKHRSRPKSAENGGPYRMKSQRCGRQHDQPTRHRSTHYPRFSAKVLCSFAELAENRPTG